MISNKKPQEGVFIGVFALATLVVISLAIGFMSNRVNDLLNNQGQMIAGKQAYWLANSGVEIIAQDKLADLGSATIPVKGAVLPIHPDGSAIGVTYDKYYSFAGGSIQIVGDNPAGAGYHNGLARTKHVIITGSDANSAHQIKWTLGSPVYKAYNFTFSDGTRNRPTLTMTSAVSGIAIAANMSISAWVHMDAIDQKPLFGENGTAGNYWIEFTSATVMDFKGIGGSNPTLSLTHNHTIETGSWQHIFIKRLSSTVTVYVNGLAGISSPDPWDAAFAPDAVGKIGTTKYFDGRITQLAIWTRALDEHEIQSIYCQGYTFSLITNADGGVGAGLDQNLLHYWKLDNLTGYNDSKGINHLVSPDLHVDDTGI
jgi:hypothetical protein